MGPPDTPQPARRILIVRPSALGDVARTVPALATLRRAAPKARIDWLVQHTFAPVIEHHPMLDGAVPFYRHWGKRTAPHRSLVQAAGFIRRLRRGRYDAVYDLQGLARSGLFTRLTGSPRRVGFADAREGGWLGCNVRRRTPPQAIHAVDRTLALLEADGFEPVHDMRLYVGDDDQAWLDTFKRQHGLGADDPGSGGASGASGISGAGGGASGAGGGYACIAPTARWACKCWPLDRYTHIARRLLETRIAGDKLVILASPAERPHVQRLLADLGPLADRALFPATTVGQMMAILSEARLLVCNDSAPLHIAVGFDRPLVTIFGPTDPSLVGPYRRPHTIVRPPHADAHPQKLNYRDLNDQTLIAQVPIEAVWTKVEETMQPQAIA